MKTSWPITEGPWCKGAPGPVTLVPAPFLKSPSANLSVGNRRRLTDHALLRLAPREPLTQPRENLRARPVVEDAVADRRADQRQQQREELAAQNHRGDGAVGAGAR